MVVVKNAKNVAPLGYANGLYKYFEKIEKYW